MQDPFDRKVRYAEGHKKIFDNRVKYIVFFLTVCTGSVVLWDKCHSLYLKDQAQKAQMVADSTAGQPRHLAQKGSAVSLTKKHHTKNQHNGETTEIKQPDNAPTINSHQGSLTKEAPKTNASLQTADANNIQFNLMAAEGSIRGQTIKMTVVLITSAANWHIWSDVHSIIDPEGNEYKLKSFTNGASAYDSHVTLNTGVPIKLTYTFGGILPSVRSIKLFKFEYQLRSLDDPLAIEFRDVPVEWK